MKHKKDNKIIITKKKIYNIHIITFMFYAIHVEVDIFLSSSSQSELLTELLNYI